MYSLTAVVNIYLTWMICSLVKKFVSIYIKNRENRMMDGITMQQQQQQQRHRRGVNWETCCVVSVVFLVLLDFLKVIPGLPSRPLSKVFRQGTSFTSEPAHHWNNLVYIGSLSVPTFVNKRGGKGCTSRKIGRHRQGGTQRIGTFRPMNISHPQFSRLYERSGVPLYVDPKAKDFLEGHPPYKEDEDPYSSSGKLAKGPLELNRQNVEALLDDVRPYLHGDGGDCKVVKIADNKVFLQLQGACGNCPSSVVTVKMGIERRLKERIPSLVSVETVNPYDASGDVDALSPEGIEKVLQTIRPFLSVTGGNVELVSLNNPPEGIGCSAVLQLTGKISGGISLSIKSEIVARMKRKYPLLSEVTVRDPPPQSQNYGMQKVDKVKAPRK